MFHIAMDLHYERLLGLYSQCNQHDRILIPADHLGLRLDPSISSTLLCSILEIIYSPSLRSEVEYTHPLLYGLGGSDECVVS